MVEPWIYARKKPDEAMQKAQDEDANERGGNTSQKKK
jgi:hypothetical protein